jgi:predicted DCC family thiol-disulfide oxidoreductase YuxK
MHSNDLGRIPLLRLMCVSVGLWIVFAKLIVPPIIESAYRGESFSFFNSIIQGQKLHPVAFYLQLWDRIAMPVLVSGFVFWLLAIVTSSPAFFRKFVGEATPGSLGAIRMLTCGILLLGTLVEDLPSIAQLPNEVRQPFQTILSGQNGGVLRFFYILPIGFDKLVTSESSLRLFQWLTELLLFLGLIGLWTRVVIPLGAFCEFIFLGILIDYSFFWHQGLVPLYVLAALSWMPCGDGWSVDRLWRVYQGRSVPKADCASPVYGWSRYLCWVVVVPAYVLNGLSKLEDGGLYWWNATNFRQFLYLDSLMPRWFDGAFYLYIAPAPDILFALVALTSVIMEVFFGLVLFSRTARRILPFAAMMMHAGICLLQRFLFFDLILLQFIFWDWTAIRKAVGERLAISRGRIHVLYDGLCPLCRRTVRLLACLDLLHRLEVRDFRQLDLTDYTSSHALNLKPADLEKEMYVISRGRVYPGFCGYRVIALALPAFWPIAPWLFLPGISSLGAWAYRKVAGNRLKLLLCDSHCAVQPSAEAEAAGPNTRNDASRGLGFPLAMSGIVGVSLLCWFWYVEFYPLTSWHLYSYTDNSGKVTYLKVFARYESGLTSRARLEDTIGAVAFDGRYWPAIEKCFGKTSDLDICNKFLAAAGSAYNKKARPSDKVTQYQIEKWTWDFLSNPSDPHYGNLVDRFILDIRN